MWSDLKQDDKYEIIRDYVRRGYNNLDSIIEDYEKNTDSMEMIANNNNVSSALRDVLNEWYTSAVWPDAGYPDVND